MNPELRRKLSALIGAEVDEAGNIAWPDKSRQIDPEANDMPPGTGFMRSSSGAEYQFSPQGVMQNGQMIRQSDPPTITPNYGGNPVDLQAFGIGEKVWRAKGAPNTYVSADGQVYSLKQPPSMDAIKAERDWQEQQARIAKLNAEAAKALRERETIPGVPNVEWKYDAGSDEWVGPPTQDFPMGQRSGSVAKAGAAKSLQYLIDQYRGPNKDGPLYNTTQGGPLGVFGMAGKVFDSQAQKRFNNLKEQLSTELRTLFRIPGEGTLSDKEQAQYGIQLPDVTNDPDINEKILTDIQNRVGLRLEGANPLKQKPAKPDDPLVVVAPDGVPRRFPSVAAAQAFRKAVGL